MNIIIVNIDSLRKDHLACFGNPWIYTPNFDKFFEKSIVFDNFCLNCIPTIPFRRCMMLGRHVYPFKDAMFIQGVTPILGWQPMGHDELTVQEVLKNAGYVTGMVTDVYHFFKPSLNFHRGFDSWQLIRGQEGDPLLTGASNQDPGPYVYPKLDGTKMQNFMEQHVFNIEDRLSEEDCFAPRVFRTAEKWLERNTRYYEDFFLYIDSFDPHEPWDAPKEYVELYDPGYKGKEMIFPQNGPDEDLTPEEVKHIRAMYAAEVTMVDRWFGHFMEKFNLMGLGKDTAVLLLTDHGLPLGEHGVFKKIAPALYNELLDVPMMLMLPEESREHKRIKGMVQECDITPTMLKLMGVEAPDTMDGLDFWPLITGEKEEIREYAYGGYHTYAYTRDQKYHYFRGLSNENDRHLFDIENDPLMEKDLIDVEPAVVKMMEERLIKSLDGWELPEQIGASAAGAPYAPLGRKRADAWGSMSKP